MKREKPKKILVILPSDDVRKIEGEVLKGKYVTKSDFLRLAVKQLLSEEGRTMISRAEISASKNHAQTYGEVLAILEKNKRKINGFGAKEIGIFGSYVRNEQTADSDIDLLVEFSPNRKNFHNYMKLKFFLENILGKKVDLIIKEAIRSELKEQILGSVVYV